MNVIVSINPSDMARGMAKSELIEFIIELDKRVGDCAFTTDLLLALKDSCLGDFDDDEWNQIMEDMKR